VSGSGQRSVARISHPSRVPEYHVRKRQHAVSEL
jgi:hypothetical protein